MVQAHEHVDIQCPGSEEHIYIYREREREREILKLIFLHLGLVIIYKVSREIVSLLIIVFAIFNPYRSSSPLNSLLANYTSNHLVKSMHTGNAPVGWHRRGP